MDLLRVLLGCILVVSMVTADHSCPRGCRCTASHHMYARHRWHRLLAAYRMQRLVHGHRQGSRNIDMRSYHRPTSTGREMTCLGLKQMPNHIPSDMSKVTFFGDKRGSIYQQDQAARSGFLADGGEISDSFPGTSTKSDLQLTKLTKETFSQAAQLKELAIEGNRVKVIYPNNLENLNNLRKLRLRSNHIKVMMPGSLQGLDQLEELDLSENRIRRVNRRMFNDAPRVRKLYLKDNQIKKVNKKLFRALKDLEILDLSDNRIQDLHKDIFWGMSSMRELSLDNNQLTRIRGDWFYYTNNLVKLSIKNNKITKISKELFTGLHNLRYLDLQHNHIGSIFKETFDPMTLLVRLDLSHNKVKFFEEDAFKGLSQTTFLSLAHNHISELRNGSFNGLYNLMELNMANNELLHLQQSALKNLRRVQRFDASHNKIKVLRYRNFFGMIDLRELRLDHNDIRHVDDETFAVSIVNSYSKITWIYLNNNKLSTLGGRSLYGLHYLKFLNLGTNHLYSVHENTFSVVRRLNTLLMYDNKVSYLRAGQFKHLSYLRHLSLADNDLKDITFNCFKGLKEVTDINIEGNEISTLSPESFLDTPHLIALNLKNNDLREIDMKILDASKRLKYLDLAKNRLSKISMPTMFEEHLMFLSLYDNLLTSLPEDITRTLGPGGSLHLYGNPWRCDCNLAWLQKYSQSSTLRLADADDIVCKSPQALAGEQILSLEEEDMSCDHPVADIPETSPLSCDFMDNIHEGNTRSNIKSQKKDVLEWVVTFYDIDHRVVCTGILIEEDSVLTHSHCWKEEVNIAAINATFGEASGDTKAHAQIESIMYYPGGLDLALVKLHHTNRKLRKFPCLLSESGVTESLKVGAHGIIPVRVQWDKPRARVKLNAFPFKSMSPKKCDGESMCVRGLIRDIKIGKYISNGQPYLLKVGRSKWAVAGFTMDREDLKDNLRVVEPLNHAVNWIHSLV